jgi:hypothetical protein
MPKNPFFNAPSKIRRDEEGLVLQSSEEAFGRRRETSSSQSYDTPVFLTPQSLLTFPGASLAVHIIWHIAAIIHPPLANLNLVPILGALLIGIFIYSQSYTEEMTRKEKIAAMFIAVINSFWIAAIVLDIDITSTPTSQE